MSDHNAVSIEFSFDNMQSNDDLMATDIRKFHKFPWHNELFVDEYNKSTESMITVFNPQVCDLSYNDKCELISASLMDLSKLLLRCARQSENKVCKVKRAKKERRDLWTPELFETHNNLNKWRIEYKKVNSERHRCLWEFYKKKFKSMQREVNELNKKVIALDLEKLLRIDRNKFWKKIKQYKKLSTKCNTQPSFERFSEFYSNLFINEIVDTDEHKKIKEGVELKKSDLAGKIYEDTFKALDVEEAIKLLKTNKSSGVDYVCAEMIKSCSNSILINNLVKIFNIIVKYGLKVNSINVSLITPIPKKNNATDNPDDYRPISVSTSFALLYEQLILGKINAIFNFSSNQFGYKKHSSCKHASFVINESRQYFVNGKSPLYIINLDMKKAFDKLWRNGLFLKLIDKLDDKFWRALVNYYETSTGMVKLDGRVSGEFKIMDGVKQGGVLSSFYSTSILMI